MTQETLLKLTLCYRIEFTQMAHTNDSNREIQEHNLVMGCILSRQSNSDDVMEKPGLV
jgi:hypothetical protein